MMKSLSGILKQKKVKMVIAVIALVAAVHFLFMLLPYPELEVFLQREFSTRIYDRKNNLVQITALQNGLRREFVSQTEIPKNIKRAFIFIAV